MLISGEFLTKPNHGAIEMVQLQIVNPINPVIVAPNLAGAIGTRHHQTVQHGQKNGALDGKLEPASSEQFFNHGRTATVAPQPLEHQRRPDAPTPYVGHAAFLDQGQDHRPL